MERKLASIQIVESIEPIPNADMIVKAKVMGWDVVVKKDKFKPGDKCVFFEIDAVLPDGYPWAEFMRPRKFRVKTCKLRGVLSQGLAMPLDILPREHISEDGVVEQFNPYNLEVGNDVTEILRVKKYEIPEHHGGAKMGNSSGVFPSRLARKTDETRIQSALAVIEELKGKPFYISVKCDGTSGTFVHDGEEFMACSRNFKKREDDTNVYWQAARRYDLPNKLAAHPFMAVQGEVCGPGLQANRLMLKDIDLFVFNVFDSKAGRYLDYYDFIDFCNMLDLQTVPIERVVSENELDTFDYSFTAWLRYAKGKYANTTKNREGIVVRPLVETYSPTLQGRLSFKVINNDFLLKDEK